MQETRGSADSGMPTAQVHTPVAQGTAGQQWAPTPESGQWTGLQGEGIRMGHGSPADYTAQGRATGSPVPAPRKDRPRLPLSGITKGCRDAPVSSPRALPGPGQALTRRLAHRTGKGFHGANPSGPLPLPLGRNSAAEQQGPGTQSSPGAPSRTAPSPSSTAGRPRGLGPQLSPPKGVLLSRGVTSTSPYRWGLL